MIDRAGKLNRASWDERATLHGNDDTFYDAAGVVAGANSLSSLELGLVGDADSISWARRGARVTGVDFSPAAVDKASIRAAAKASGSSTSRARRVMASSAVRRTLILPTVAASGTEDRPNCAERAVVASMMVSRGQRSR
ncbi:hypothetical protein [Amycolatopsis sp. NPDC004378]